MEAHSRLPHPDMCNINLPRGIKKPARKTNAYIRVLSPEIKLLHAVLLTFQFLKERIWQK